MTSRDVADRLPILFAGIKRRRRLLHNRSRAERNPQPRLAQTTLQARMNLDGESKPALHRLYIREIDFNPE
jgi:hypothetical protein